MNITPKERLDILLDINILMTRYTDSNGSDYRPSISDYITYHTMLSMYDADYADIEPYTLWRKKPDQIMFDIYESNKLFTIDYGWDDLHESIREWLALKGFIVSSDDLSEEEYNKLIEEQ